MEISFRYRVLYTWNVEKQLANALITFIVSVENKHLRKLIPKILDNHYLIYNPFKSINNELYITFNILYDEKYIERKVNEFVGDIYKVLRNIKLNPKLPENYCSKQTTFKIREK